MSDLVENPEDRFSHNEAHIVVEFSFAVGTCETSQVVPAGGLIGFLTDLLFLHFTMINGSN